MIFCCIWLDKWSKRLYLEIDWVRALIRDPLLPIYIRPFPTSTIKLPWFCRKDQASNSEDTWFCLLIFCSTLLIGWCQNCFIDSINAIVYTLYMWSSIGTMGKRVQCQKAVDLPSTVLELAVEKKHIPHKQNKAYEGLSMQKQEALHMGRAMPGCSRVEWEWGRTGISAISMSLLCASSLSCCWLSFLLRWPWPSCSSCMNRR